MSSESLPAEVINASTVTPSSLPVPNAPVKIRVATMADLAGIDALQKKHSKQLGFFPRQQWEGYIGGGWVLVAEGDGLPNADLRFANEERGNGAASALPQSQIGNPRSQILGYCASRDRYQKRDELGCIFQMCVAPAGRRKLVAATLLRHVFERAAYGCRLYCCWCAQDLTAANRFWEAMGFVPLAFRAGSRKKDRVHIFWQKRIRAGDEVTPWWFPACTGGGALREDRVVLPIPPGVKWWEEMPRLLPGSTGVSDERRVTSERWLVGEVGEESRADRKSAIANRKSTEVVAADAGLSGLRFGGAGAAKSEEKKRVKKERPKVSAEQAAKARELRDRFLEAAVAGRLELAGAVGKYDVCRGVEDERLIEGESVPLLAA